MVGERRSTNSGSWLTKIIAPFQSESELAIARKIQSGFLPRALPKVEGWDVDVRFHSAREVAGEGDRGPEFPEGPGPRQRDARRDARARQGIHLARLARVPICGRRGHGAGALDYDRRGAV